MYICICIHIYASIYLSINMTYNGALSFFWSCFSLQVGCGGAQPNVLKVPCASN